MKPFRHNLPALLAALFGLVFQLSLSAQAAAPAREMAAPGFHPHLCAAMPSAPGEKAPPHHGGMDCLHCTLCASVAGHAALLPPLPALAPARGAQLRPLPGPAETARPLHPPAAAFTATGPPRLG